MYSASEQLDIALQELFDGAPFESVLARYPDLRAELEAHAAIVRTLGSISSIAPSQAGLSRALNAQVSAPMPTPYLAFFTTYRAALALPVLILVFIGAGVLLYPKTGTAPNVPVVNVEGTTGATEPADMAAPQILNTQAPALPSASQKKSAPESGGGASFGAQNRVMLMTAPSMTEATDTATSTASTTSSQ